MPYAIVIHAFPKSDLPLAHTQGKVLHGIFYETLKQASVTKGEEVHEREGIKPFQLRSCLPKGKGGKRPSGPARR